MPVAPALPAKVVKRESLWLFALLPLNANLGAKSCHTRGQPRCFPQEFRRRRGPERIQTSARGLTRSDGRFQSQGPVCGRARMREGAAGPGPGLVRGAQVQSHRRVVADASH